MELLPRPYVIRSRQLSTETFVSGRLITVTRKEKDYVLPDWDLGRQGEEPLRRKDGEDLLECDPRFWGATTCYTSLRVVFLVVLNRRRKPSRIAGMQLPIIHRTLNTKVHSGVGLSESSLRRLWLSAKASQRTPFDETTCASPTPKYSLNMPRFLSLKCLSTSQRKC